MRISRGPAAAIAFGLAAVVAGCAARPVVYPNARTAQVGDAGLERDIDDCTRLARTHAREGSALARDAARGTVAGGAIGAATGAVGGAIWGNVGRGAATGAAVGATSGLLGSIFRRAPGEDPVERRFVERCLAERGYDVIGWR
jgi:outer membrane lipoprotein SlyB